MTNHDNSGGELTPDELEQRQRADGSYEQDATADEDLDRPLTPDEIEQRQDAGGTVGSPDPLDDRSGDHLEPDEIDQRRVVEIDDDDDVPVTTDEE